MRISFSWQGKAPRCLPIMPAFPPWKRFTNPEKRLFENALKQKTGSSFVEKHYEFLKSERG